MPWWPWAKKKLIEERDQLRDEAAAARREWRDIFERTLCVLREENSTLRRMLEQSNSRADSLALDLARAVVVQAPAITPQVASVPPRRTSRDPIEGLGNIFAPVDYTHPDATFGNERAASLMQAEEDEPDGATAAA